MSDNQEDDSLHRKRRKIEAKNIDKMKQESHDVSSQTLLLTTSSYDFLHLASLIFDQNISILFSKDNKLRNCHKLLEEDKLFLVFQEFRTMNDVYIKSNQAQFLTENMILKHIKVHLLFLELKVNNDTVQYILIITELQILTDSRIAEHENFINLLDLI